MINFPENKPILRQLAHHYAAKLEKPLLAEFLANELHLTDHAQAQIVCNQFQQLIDYAMMDNSQPEILKDISDLENHLFALFNLVYNAMLNLGFEEQWQQASDNARQQQE